MENTLCVDRTTFWVGVVIIAVLVWKWNNDRDTRQIEIMSRISNTTRDIDVLAQRRAFQRLADEQQQKDRVVIRDEAVINDQLYPPLGRTERPVFDGIQTQFNTSTRDTNDTYRLIGYLVNKTSDDLGNKVWMLFGRQKYRGSSQGEFYAIPSHGDRKQIKVQLEDNMFVGEKMRDIYALPNKVTINSPFFSTDEYEVVQLPRSDFTSQYI